MRLSIILILCLFIVGCKDNKEEYVLEQVNVQDYFKYGQCEDADDWPDETITFRNYDTIRVIKAPSKTVRWFVYSRDVYNTKYWDWVRSRVLSEYCDTTHLHTQKNVRKK